MNNTVMNSHLSAGFEKIYHTILPHFFRFKIVLYFRISKQSVGTQKKLSITKIALTNVGMN
ncbi:hypothetical protein DERF_007569 [Dermatophagoides farinae]|uniref:Uncharacterized protein n=1 Tax=Dermatophagoides farinae TaxID=6954 RepID=A0A922L859_DERFA|nr:hypothetical protein DERF_007569 [Dermatophagoides farinae]